ncbi:MAG TPA: PSD1 and planctomycete cytochrome C domain-containing protein, partial [Acidobacteriaceae bacterium]
MALASLSLFASANAMAQQSAAPADAVAAQSVLQKNCYGCHTDKMKGGLRVDSVRAMLKGGDSGPVIVPGHPEQSLLVSAIRYKNQDLQMPPKGPMADRDVAVLEEWIRAGAHDLPAAAGKSDAASVAAAPNASALSAQEQYFETNVRPLLIENCYSCHTDGESGGLRLDSRAAVLKGGKDGVVVNLEHPEQSLLLKAVHYTDQGLQMPPKGPLGAGQVAVLEQWIRDGAVWPNKGRETMTATVTDKDRAYWAYQKPVKPAVPAASSKWVTNDIDRFVWAKLEEQHLAPVKDADKRTLIRRVTYDLTGLPPTPAEVDAFLADKSSDAYVKVVDRLLASKAYGERWGRIWMDVIRYSDTSGEGADFPIPEIYKYRDYIIQSFNQDTPYNRFIKEQLAGDLLPAASEPEHWRNVIATGYLANANRYEDQVSDAVDNVGYAFLGTSIACARCHDHKFDPIPTADYYGIYGILASTQFSNPGEEETRFERNMVYRDPNVVKSPEYLSFEAQLKPISDSIHAVHQLPYFDDVLPALEARRMALFEHAPHFEDAYAVTEGTPHDEHVQHLGDKKNLGDLVPRHFLQVLGNWQLPADTKGSGRLELANWIASPDNPLTARVMVNRLWQGHFGRGIVATTNDFGKRGSPPSNQALLDYLAVTFEENGWSIKTMQRMIVLSHTYRLSSGNDAVDEKADPDNVYLWRHSRMRMDAEEIRDAMLATSGRLDLSPAGPQPFPPPGQWNYSGHVPFHAVYETDHRTVYVMTQRSRRHPYLGLFDGADGAASVAQRDTSITPLQSLYFMNASFPKVCAASLAEKLESANLSAEQEIDRAFMVLYGRHASRDEVAHAEDFIVATARIYKTQGAPQGPQASPLLHQAALSSAPDKAGSAGGQSQQLPDAEAHKLAVGN